MIRVLFVRRQNTGGMAEYADALAESLEEFGVEAVVDDAESWIPSKTGWMVDRQVTKLLKSAVKGFDLVHAFGYRTAWACSEAFYVRSPWLYTAFDMPKTTHPQLIDRLNAAKRGMCSSRAVRDKLRTAEALHLEVSIPCIADEPPLDGRDALRDSLGVARDHPMILWADESESESELTLMLQAYSEVAAYVPSCRLVLSTRQILTGLQQGMISSYSRQVTVVEPNQKESIWIKAADVVVVAARGLGFSMKAARSMALGTTVMLRREDGLSEMAADGDSGFYFDLDSELGEKLRLLLESPLTNETVGRAGMIRAHDRFDASTAASVMARLYRDILDL